MSKGAALSTAVKGFVPKGAALSTAVKGFVPKGAALSTAVKGFVSKGARLRQAQPPLLAFRRSETLHAEEWSLSTTAECFVSKGGP